MRKKLNIKTIVLFAIALYVGSLFISQRINAYKLKQEISKQQKELARLKETNQRLQDEVEMSKTEGYMERLARERLGLVKDREIPIIHSSSKQN
jgi:cell division protein FtsL